MSIVFDQRKSVLRKQQLLNGCSFRFLPPEQWTFRVTAASPRLMRGPRRGYPSGPHAKVRCPECGRRLGLKAMYNSGSGEEFSHWQIPEHRRRVAQTRTPKRQSATTGRGR